MSLSQNLSQEKRKKLERFARLRPIVPALPAGKPSDQMLVRSLAALADALRTSGETAALQVRLVSERRELARTLALSPTQVGVVSGPGRRANLEIVLSPDDWWSIARGEVAPAAVFLMGRLAIRGDCKLARRIYRHLAAAKGVVDVPA